MSEQFEGNIMRRREFVIATLTWANELQEFSHQMVHQMDPAMSVALNRKTFILSLQKHPICFPVFAEAAPS